MRNEEKNKHKVKNSTERSDFAAQQTIAIKCRGWRPRQPTPLTFRIIVYLTTLDNPTNIGRGEHRSPVLRTCINSES